VRSCVCSPWSIALVLGMLTVSLATAYKASLNTERRMGFRWRDEQLARWKNEDPLIRGEFNVPVVIPPSFERSEFVRESILALSLLTWLTAFVVLLSGRARQDLCARVLLVSGGLCLLCWLLSPSYPSSLKGMFSNDPLAYGLMMLAFSIGAALFPLRPVSHVDESVDGAPTRLHS